MEIIILVSLVICTIIIVYRINMVSEMIKNLNLPIKNLDCLAVINNYDNRKQTLTVEPVEISNFNSTPGEFDFIRHPESIEVLPLSKSIKIEIFDDNSKSKNANLEELLNRIETESKLLVWHVVIKNGFIEEIYEQ